MGLFTGKLNAGEVFETLANGVDKLNFSPQERAKQNELLADKVAEFAKDSLGESTVRSQTRRSIAIMIIISYLLITFAYIAVKLLNFQDIDFFETILTDSPIATGFILVIAFFFGGYYLRNFKNFSLNRKKNGDK